jgi:hypothetical protein
MGAVLSPLDAMLGIDDDVSEFVRTPHLCTDFRFMLTMVQKIEIIEIMRFSSPTNCWLYFSEML